MRFQTVYFIRVRQTALVLLLGLIGLLSIVISGPSLAQQPDSRPRTTGANPSATPTPGQPTPTPQSGPGRRIAPQLGAPPPPPVLKPKPTPTPDPTTAEISEGERLTINTELVTLNVRVIDRNNRPINNIGKDEFRVFEDGVPQSIFSFTEEEVPVIYGLAVDTSGSLRPAFEQVINAAKAIINSNKKGDETFLERFISSDKIETIQDFTASKDALMDGLDTLYIEGGQTAVIDGVYLAAEHVAEYKRGSNDDRRRRALIVVTDGEDRASYYPEADLFRRLREEDVQIYVIGFVNDVTIGGDTANKGEIATVRFSIDSGFNGILVNTWNNGAFNGMQLRSLGLYGDYDQNGSIGPGDYQAWKNSFGSTTNLNADGNGDGVVDAADYVIWRSLALGGGAGSGLGSAAVPEPCTGLMAWAAIALVGGAAARRRFHAGN